MGKKQLGQMIWNMEAGGHIRNRSTRTEGRMMWYLCLTTSSGVFICKYSGQDYKIVRKCSPTTVTITDKSLEMENAFRVPSTDDCPLLVFMDHSLCAQLF